MSCCDVLLRCLVAMRRGDVRSMLLDSGLWLAEASRGTTLASVPASAYSLRVTRHRLRTAYTSTKVLLKVPYQVR
jgi:hypothetical protein